MSATDTPCDQPVAALDVGSNTIRLIVARPINGDLQRSLDRSAFVRLGAGVDKTGMLEQERMGRAVEVIGQFAEQAREAGARAITAVATSAVRDARNGRDFVGRVREEAGIDVEIITGDREADLTYLGATLGTGDQEAVIVDLGGGSAEVIAAGEGGMRWGQSLPLGGSRLTERFVQSDPPGQEELDRVAAYVRECLASLPPFHPSAAIFTGGTARHILLLLRLEGRRVCLSAGQLQEAISFLYEKPTSEIAERYDIEPARAEVLPAGIRALQEIAAFYGVDTVTITLSGIREGMIVDLLRREGCWH